MERNLDSIFSSITPDNIQEIDAIKDAMAIFTETLEELSKESIDIKNIYENDVIREQLLKIYLNDLYEVIKKLQYNSIIAKKIEEVNAIYDDDNPYYDVDAIFNLVDYIEDEHFLTLRQFNESKGTTKSIEYIYKLISIFITPSETPELSLTEVAPFQYEIEGTMAKEFYEYAVAPLAHPMGFCHSYTQYISLILEDFYAEETITYDIYDLEVRSLDTNGNTTIYDYKYDSNGDLRTVTNIYNETFSGETNKYVVFDDGTYLKQTTDSTGQTYVYYMSSNGDVIVFYEGQSSIYVNYGFNYDVNLKETYGEENYKRIPPDLYGYYDTRQIGYSYIGDKLPSFNLGDGTDVGDGDLIVPSYYAPDDLEGNLYVGGQGWYDIPSMYGGYAQTAGVIDVQSFTLAFNVSGINTYYYKDFTNSTILGNSDLIGSNNLYVGSLITSEEVEAEIYRNFWNYTGDDDQYDNLSLIEQTSELTDTNNEVDDSNISSSSTSSLYDLFGYYDTRRIGSSYIGELLPFSYMDGSVSIGDSNAYITQDGDYSGDSLQGNLFIGGEGWHSISGYTQTAGVIDEQVSTMEFNISGFETYYYKDFTNSTILGNSDLIGSNNLYVGSLITSEEVQAEIYRNLWNYTGDDSQYDNLSLIEQTSELTDTNNEVYDSNISSSSTSSLYDLFGYYDTRTIGSSYINDMYVGGEGWHDIDGDAQTAGVIDEQETTLEFNVSGINTYYYKDFTNSGKIDEFIIGTQVQPIYMNGEYSIGDEYVIVDRNAYDGSSMNDNIYVGSLITSEEVEAEIYRNLWNYTGDDSQYDNLSLIEQTSELSDTNNEVEETTGFETEISQYDVYGYDGLQKVGDFSLGDFFIGGEGWFETSGQSTQAVFDGGIIEEVTQYQENNTQTNLDTSKLWLSEIGQNNATIGSNTYIKYAKTTITVNAEPYYNLGEFDGFSDDDISIGIYRDGVLVTDNNISALG